MLPGSSSGITSFSFHIPTSQRISNHHHIAAIAPTTQPPSALVLRSAGSTGRLPGSCALPASISTLPLVLIHQIHSWMTSKESLPLIMTSRQIHHQVQAVYKKLLRPTVAEKSRSYIASFQNSVNIAPVWLPMQEEGEVTYQTCLKMKATGLTEAAYRHGVLAILKRCIAESSTPHHLCEVSTGIGLGLGGTLMTAENRDALLTLILDSYATCDKDQMGAMMLGVTVAFGCLNSQHHLLAALDKILAFHTKIDSNQMREMSLFLLDGTGRFGRCPEQLVAVLTRILGSTKRCSPKQMGALMNSVGMMLEGPDMTPVNRDFVLTKIMDYRDTSQPMQLAYMIIGFCRALGTVNMPPTHRDGLLEKILGEYANNRRMPLTEMSFALGDGLGGSLMKEANLDVVLARVMGCYASLNQGEMGSVIGHLGMALGGMNMSPANRDRITAGILNSYATSSPAQIGKMLGYLCKSIRRANPGEIDITQDNLEAILVAVLNSHATSSPAQMGSMIENIFLSVGHATMSLAHRGTFATRIQESEHANKIIAAIKLRPGGQRIVGFLQLKNSSD